MNLQKVFIFTLTGTLLTSIPSDSILGHMYNTTKDAFVESITGNYSNEETIEYEEEETLIETETENSIISIIETDKSKLKYSDEGYIQGYVNENGDYVAPFKYGEIINNTFARTLMEEIKSIPEDYENWVEEKNKVIKARTFSSETEMTPEMIADGYVWISAEGAVQDPDSSEGEDGEASNVIKNYNASADVTYDENGNPVVSVGNGYVTFSATTQSNIHETCYVQVTNTTSFKIYEFDLFEINDYTTSVQLPAGSYIVSGGGIPNDFKSEYPINQISFKVTEGAACVVPLIIGNVDEEAINNGITIELNEVEEETESVIEEETKTNPWSVIKVVLFILLIIGALIFYFIYSLKKTEGN